MERILISINPEYVEKILSGEKRFEFRTKIPKKLVDTLLIYETAPVQRVVAEAKIIEVLEMAPDKLWEKTREYAGIDRQFFDAYFFGRTTAYAYRLGKIRVYEEPRDLSYFGVKTAPQSFVYVR